MIYNEFKTQAIIGQISIAKNKKIGKKKRRKNRDYK